MKNVNLFSKTILLIFFGLLFGFFSAVFAEDKTTTLALTNLNIFQYCNRTYTTCNLSSKKITSIAPGTFKDFPNLKHLYLDNNQITSLPEFMFSGLTHLQYISLNNNQITSLPEKLFSGLVNLQNLYVNDNNITNIPVGTFSGLIYLQYLSLDNNKISSLQANLFSGLPNLVDLRLHNNRISTIESGVFSGLDSLSYISLDSNKLETLPVGVFSGLPNGTYISIPDNCLDQNTLDIDTVNRITHDGNSSFPQQGGFCGEILGKISDVFPDPRLAEVVANHLGLGTGDAAYRSQLSSITYLSAGGYDIVSLSGISLLKNLQQLYVNNNQISNLPEKLFSGLENLQYLSLNNNQISNLPENLFSGLVNLQQLSLNNNQISSLPENIFSGLINLQQLYVNDNKIGSVSENLFLGLVNIQYLSLNNNKLETLPVGVFSDLPSNSYIRLYGNCLDQNTLDIDTVNKISKYGFPGQSLLCGPIAGKVSDLFPDIGLAQAIANQIGIDATDSVYKAQLDATTYLNASRYNIVSLSGINVLKNLQDLYLNDNNITNIPVGAFSGLINLQSLYLDHNRISTIETGVFSGLINLQYLYVNNNQIRSLPATIFSGLENLQYLSLDSNKLETLPVGIFSDLPSNTEISIYDNCLDENMLDIDTINKISRYGFPSQGGFCGEIIGNISDFFQDQGLIQAVANQLGIKTDDVIYSGQLESLSYLNAGGYNIESLSGIGLLKNVQSLYLNNNQITTLPEGVFSGLPNIHDLYLNDNKITTIESGVFAGLNVLGSLYLYNNKLETLPVGVFSNLPGNTNLSISENCLDQNLLDIDTINRITNNGAYDFPSKSLSCGPILGKVSDVFPDPNLAEAVASRLGLSIDNDIHQTQLDILTYLYAQNSNITSLSGINLLRNVESLSFNNNQITSLPEAIFSGLGALTYLELSNNYISTIGTGVFTGLTGLANLHIENNKLQTLPVGIFSDLPENANIYLHQNCLDKTTLDQDTINKITYNGNSIFPGQGGECGPIAGKISDIFPDPGLARLIADQMRISIENEVYESQLQNISYINPYYMGVSYNIVSLSGINRLKSIQTLYLDYNQIRNLSVDTFSGLTELQTLYLGNNQIDNLPIGIFSGLSSLQNISLGGNQIRGLSKGIFSGLKSLKYLSLDYNKISTIETGVFAGLTSLQDIDLHSNQIKTLPVETFSGLYKLQTIYLDNNQINTIQVGLFSGLTGLQSLNLGSNRLETLPVGVFSDLPSSNLYIHVYDNCLDTSTLDVDTLNRITQNGANGFPTQSLLCGPIAGKIGDLFPDPGFAQTMADMFGLNTGASLYFPQLNSITYLGNSSYPIISLSGINILKNLQSIVIDNNQITSLPSGLFDGLSGLLSIQMTNNKISQIGTGLFSGLPNLYNINLSKNKIQYFPPGSFSGLVGLQYFYLENNSLSEVSSGLFSNLPNLIHISMGNNKIRSLSAGVFSNLPKVTSISLTNNKISSLAVGVFSGIGSLQILSLDNNKLETLLTGVFSSLPTNATINVNNNCLNKSALDADTVNRITKNGYFGFPSQGGICGVVAGILSDLFPDIGLTQAVASKLGISIEDEVYQSQLDATTYLQAGGYNIVSLSGINLLKNVQNLYLNNNQITTIPKNTFNGLSGLTYLNLSDNKIATIENGAFSGLNSSISLIFDNNKLEVLSSGVFSDLSNNAYISLYNNCLDKDILDVGTINKITQNGTYSFPSQSLLCGPILGILGDIFPDPGLTQAIINQIGMSREDQVYQSQLNTITYLNAGGYDIVSLSGLNLLKKIQQLYADNNQITTLPDSVFNGLGNLRNIQLSSNKISSIGTGVFTGLTGLESLYLGNNKLETLSMGIFSDIPMGSTIDISSNCLDQATLDTDTLNKITNNGANGFPSQGGLCGPIIRLSNIFPDLGLAQAIANQMGVGIEDDIYQSQLDTMTYLNAGGYNIVSLHGINTLKNLETLYLNNNQITTLSDSVFSGLGNLTYLELSNNRIATIGTGVFTGLTGLENLYLGNNKLETLPMGIFSDIPMGSTIDISSNCLDQATLDTDTLNKITNNGANGFPSQGGLCGPSLGIVSELFPDGGLAQAISDQIGISIQDDIYQSQVDNITNLDASNYNITSLSGIGLLHNLQYLYLSHNNINSLDTIDLDQLQELDVSNNKICALGLSEETKTKLDTLYGDNSWQNTQDMSSCDTDGDAVYDSIDNCPLVVNPDQANDNPLIETLFTKPDYGTQKDCITPNVCLARANKWPLYNSKNQTASEVSQMDNPNPADTEWSYGNCSDKANLSFDALFTVNGWNPLYMIGQEMCVHLISDDLYYNIIFKSWTSGAAGGGFSYTRSLDGQTGDKIGNVCDSGYVVDAYVDIPDTIDTDTITTEFTKKGYLSAGIGALETAASYLVGTTPIKVTSSAGKVLVPVIMQSTGSEDKLETQIPLGVVIESATGVAFTGILHTPTIKPKTEASVLPNVFSVASFGVANQHINFKNQDGDAVAVTVKIPAPGLAVGSPVKIYYSEDNGATWNFHTTTNIVSINQSPYAKFTTTHFTDFAISGGTGSFVINNDASTTTNQDVTLTIDAPGATQMRFSNDGSSWSSWEAYATTKSHTLSAEIGTKTVYAEFDIDGDSVADVATSDTIQYIETVGGATQGDISLEISSGSSSCSYGTTINLGRQTINSSFGAMVFSGDFLTASGSSTWSCTDFAGSPAGWNLTIQSSDLINESNNIISAFNVKISHDMPTLIAGDCIVGGTGVVDQGIETSHVLLGKQSSPQRSICRISTDNVKLKVDVPENQAPGTYAGTLTLTIPSFN